MLLRDYFNSLNFYKNGELSRNQIDRSGVQVKKENEKFTVVCSRSPQNLEFDNFTLLFCRGRQRNVQKFKTHVQSDCFPSLNLLFCSVALPSPSSLLKFSNVWNRTSILRTNFPSPLALRYIELPLYNKPPDVQYTEVTFYNLRAFHKYFAFVP